MKSKVCRTATALTAVLMLVACSNANNQVAPVSFDSVVVTDPTTTTSPASTTAVATTIAQTTVAPTLDPTTTAMSPTEGLSGPMFSDALGIKVATAPGVHTAGDTRQLLPEGLFVHIAWESDPNDLSVFSPIPEDIPILEAYTNAVATYYRAAMTDQTTTDPDFDTYMRDGGALFDESFAEARASNLVLSLGAGVVLRPYVLADESTDNTATVLDCYLQNESFVDRVLTPSTDGLLTPKGQIVTLLRTDSGWQVDLAGSEPQACL